MLPAPMTDLPPDVLKLLACPEPSCRGALEARPLQLVCVKCGRAYPLTERWPVLIPEEATQPTTDNRGG